MYGEHVGDDNAGNHKQGVQRTIGDADIVKPIRRGQPLKFPVKQAVPVKKHRGQHKEINNSQDAQQLFRRGGIAVGVGKPAVTQGDKGGAHIFHRHRRNRGLHSRGSQLQQIAYILYQRAAHDKNQQLLFLRPIPVEQEDQRRKGQAYGKALQ